MEALPAFIPTVGFVLAVILLAVLTGTVSSSDAPMLRYWSLHPWRIFWLSYVPVFAGLLLLTILPSIAYVLLVPGILLMLTSAIQGLRVTWMRSRRRASMILLISLAGMVLPRLTEGRPLVLISSPLVILLWMFAAWLAETVGLRQVEVGERTDPAGSQKRLSLSVTQFGSQKATAMGGQIMLRILAFVAAWVCYTLISDPGSQIDKVEAVLFALVAENFKIDVALIVQVRFFDTG